MASDSPDNRIPVRSQSQGRFIIGGLILVAAIIYLVVTATQANAQYFLTIDELLSRKESMQNQEVRISGAVIGNSILVDKQAMTVQFSMANIPGDQKEIDQRGGITSVLHEAVSDSALSRITIRYHGVKPDLLQNEAQAIVTGTLQEDGSFLASEVLLKCPTKYAEALPEQSE